MSRGRDESLAHRGCLDAARTSLAKSGLAKKLAHYFAVWIHQQPDARTEQATKTLAHNQKICFQPKANEPDNAFVRLLLAVMQTGP